MKEKTPAQIRAEEKRKQRTLRQNRAMHKWFTQVAEYLNDAGLDQRKVLKESVDIPWTGEAIKKQLWKPLQNALLQKESTTELTKGEVGRVEELLVRHIGQKLGTELPEWPHYAEGEYERITSGL